MKKKILLVVRIFVILIFLYGVYMLSTFSLFDDEIILIEEITLSSKNYDLKIYHIPSNATNQSYIQIRKTDNEVEEVLGSYERYNSLSEYEILDSDSLSISLKNTNLLNSSVKKIKIKLP